MYDVKNFYGEINGKTINDFIYGLDYNKKDFASRLDIVKSKLYTEELNGVPYQDRYFDEVFEQTFDNKNDGYIFVEELNKYMPYDEYENYCLEEGIEINNTFTNANTSCIRLVLSQKDGLASETNVCKGLEKLADYLLNSIEAKELDSKTQYKCYTDESLFKKIQKEPSYDKEVILDVLLEKGKNYKKSIEQKIFAKDLNNFYINEYEQTIKQYNLQIEEIDKILLQPELDKEIIKELKTKRGKLNYLKGELMQDQIICKDQLQGTIYFKAILPESSVKDYEQFDWFDKEHIKWLLKMKSKDDLQNDLACMVLDLNNLINKCNFKNDDLKIIELWRNSDLTLEDIGEELSVSQPSITQKFNTIIKKITQQYEILLEDWLYLNYRKGTYKKCSKCGEIKLVSRFDIKKSSKDGFFPYCKKCRK